MPMRIDMHILPIPVFLNCIHILERIVSGIIVANSRTQAELQPNFQNIILF